MGRFRDLTYNSIMPFGRHKGVSVLLIYQKDIQYLKWMIDNVTKVKFNSAVVCDVVNALSLKANDAYINNTPYYRAACC